MFSASETAIDSRQTKTSRLCGAVAVGAQGFPHGMDSSASISVDFLAQCTWGPFLMASASFLEEIRFLCLQFYFLIRYTNALCFKIIITWKYCYSFCTVGRMCSFCSCHEVYFQNLDLLQT
jgi:hypothetical protein